MKQQKLQSDEFNTNNEISNNNFEQISNNSFQEKKNIDPYSLNNPLNEYYSSPEILKQQENFKKYIDQQFESLGEYFGKNIENEVQKMSSMLTNKYSNYSKEINDLGMLGNFGNNKTAERNDKRLAKIQDIIEERELLNFIMEPKETFKPTKFKNYDIDSQKNLYSFFGSNIDSYENKFLNLKSKSEFVDFDKNKKNKNNINELKSDNVSDYNIDKFSDFSFGGNKTFKRNNNHNKNEDRVLRDSVGVSVSLDNKTSFVPINDNNNKIIFEGKKNNNMLEEKKSIDEKEEKKIDRIDKSIMRNLNEINNLNQNIILYDFPGKEQFLNQITQQNKIDIEPENSKNVKKEEKKLQNNEEKKEENKEKNLSSSKENDLNTKKNLLFEDKNKQINDNSISNNSNSNVNNSNSNDAKTSKEGNINESKNKNEGENDEDDGSYENSDEGEIET